MACPLICFYSEKWCRYFICASSTTARENLLEYNDGSICHCCDENIVLWFVLRVRGGTTRPVPANSTSVLWRLCTRLHSFDLFWSKQASIAPRHKCGIKCMRHKMPPPDEVSHELAIFHLHYIRYSADSSAGTTLTQTVLLGKARTNIL